MAVPHPCRLDTNATVGELVKCNAGSYLTDLEIKPTPTLLALELVNGCEQVAQRTSWFEVKKTPHLQPATHHQYFQYITNKTHNQCSYRNILVYLLSSLSTAGDNVLTSDTVTWSWGV